MLARINVWKIVREHFSTLKDISSEKSGVSWQDKILFIVIPIFIAVWMAIKGVSISSHITDLITTISIFGGFLFNLLAVIYGLMDKLSEDARGDRLKDAFTKEIHINISFNILLSIALILVLLIYSWIFDNLNTFLDVAFRMAIFFLLILFGLTLLMVLNRIYILMNKNTATPRR